MPPVVLIPSERRLALVLDATMHRLIDASVLCWLATSSASGQPSVSPKEVFVRHADRVLIANIASPHSARNIKENPRVCVAFLDVFRQKGVQVYGVAEVITKADSRFADLAAPLLTLACDAFPFASLFQITPEAAKSIIAPRYRLYPETTEADQIASAMLTYGVRPLK
jgi:predicted pyridoxine 5'-phosphate oxidase superfamily flavin-nucleotide-binding protein